MRLIIAAILLLATVCAALPGVKADCTEEVVCSYYHDWDQCTDYWVQDPNDNVEVGVSECSYSTPTMVCATVFVRSIVGGAEPDYLCAGVEA